jgi:small subunit ribosomal protein S8
MLDPISDMLTRIRNAQQAGHLSVEVPSSKPKFAIAKLLEESEFIQEVEKVSDGKKNSLKMTLKYEKNNRQTIPVIQGIKRISHEGQRIYIGKGQIKKVKNGLGIAIISTSKGIMTGAKARQLGLGGEYICEVW